MNKTSDQDVDYKRKNDLVPAIDILILFQANLTDSDGNCNVENFTIGRTGYGNIFFPGVTNIRNMNFDDIVFFRRKEVIVYPDDDRKPPLNEGLNRRAQVTLDKVTNLPFTRFSSNLIVYIRQWRLALTINT